MIQNINEVLNHHKLSMSDYKHIKEILGREPNMLEIGIFSAMWSEHCSYKSSRIYLKNFPTKAPYVVQGPGENAGIIDIGGGYCAVFKMESHNHPSFIEPYAGAATGVGGIMRDIFTMGARPIASLNAIRFGNITDKKEGKKHRYLLRGVVAGIGDYGNCMGVPTIGGETSFEACYNGNILVNAFNLGIVKKENIFYGRAQGDKNAIIYVGSKTGRDGLGGAVMSSDGFNEDSKSLRPTVQVGDPFSEKLLLEACLEVFGEDLIIGIQDMGAAGLTSSSFEMASRASTKDNKVGMKLFLDRVPTRSTTNADSSVESRMTPYEIMLSESQERMLICAKKGKEKQIIDIFKKWELEAVIIGEVTNSGNMELFFDDKLCANIPIAPVSDDAPILHREVEPPRELPSFNTPKHHKSQEEVFANLLSCAEICDKHFIYNQYDSSVQTNTIISDGRGDSSVIRIKENEAMLAMSVYCNARFCYLNPRMGAKIAVATAGRNCATHGASPLAITDCLNFGNPTNPHVMWQFSEVCEGISEACKVLNTPVVSGNVSLYNQSDEIDIYPTPSIAMVGQIRHKNLLRDSAFKQSGNLIVLLGDLGEDFGGSLWQKILYGKIASTPPNIDLNRELALWNLLTNATFIQSAKSIKEGGLAITLAKMALFGGFGIDVAIGGSKDIIFSETQSLCCIEIAQDSQDLLERSARRFGIPYKILGEVGTKGGDICIDSIKMKHSRAKELFFDSFERIIGEL